jgi:flagellar capping protein FliD
MKSSVNEEVKSTWTQDNDKIKEEFNLLENRLQIYIDKRFLQLQEHIDERFNQLDEKLTNFNR